jgi:hypothetical protein
LRKRTVTLQAENAPKGESHERRRREIKPAGQRREKTVKRVAKPCRRNVAGRQRPRPWTFAA